ncbi:hypothetical protein [Micromonospora coxensis]|uniref:WD40-like Beta Propeller Repeat n=1 Tax=Micromonospora coxensis TaxID=356852 RepID=A0A1C5HSL4_9ACTN|nr:hypothetical protein [Micromonospora coxensis]SCG48972.1 hypothetical protein GA0070614_1723 [Micromonospora coxensis]
MSVRLREALHRAAADVPAYPVHERALATARRTRRRAALAGVAAVVAVLALGLSVPAAGPARLDPAAGAEVALPDRVGLPVLGSLHATDRPRLGPAAVIFSGQAPRLHGWWDDMRVGVVAAGSDRYRVLTTGTEAPVGEQAVLSPDGRRIAHPGGSSDEPGVDVVDLVDGRTRFLPTRVDRSVLTEPVGWSVDGTRLVLRDTVPVAADGATYRSVLSIVPVDGSRWTHLADGAQEAQFGRTVAFTRDRVAYQFGRTVAVAGLDGRRLSSFPLPADTWLAGKGAWTPEGSLTVVTRAEGTDRWSLRRVDPGTGRDLGPTPLPAVDGVTTIRLLGWAADGSAWVVAYRPEPAAPARFDQPLELDQRTAYGHVRSVRVLALTPGAAVPTTLLTAPDQVLALDVADHVVRAGRVRAADPPSGVGGRFWWWTGLASAVALGLLGLRWARRRRRPSA